MNPTSSEISEMASTFCGLAGDFHTGTPYSSRGSNSTWFSDTHSSAMGLHPSVSTRHRPDKAALFQAVCRLLGACNGPCSEDMEPWVHVENCVHELCAARWLGQTVCCAEELYPGMPGARPPGAALGTSGGLR